MHGMVRGDCKHGFVDVMLATEYAIRAAKWQCRNIRAIGLPAIDVVSTLALFSFLETRLG